MYPRNVMEQAVEASLRTHRAARPGEDAACWCPLCHADVQALALCALPPRYVTRRPDHAACAAVLDNAASRDAVHRTVAQAVRQVGSHPRHGRAREPGTAAVSLINHPFEFGFSVIEGRLPLQPGSCGCWECRCDAVAFALNRFPPRYGVAVDGRSGYPEGELRQMAEELEIFIDLGVRIAASLPRHATAD